MMLFKYTTTFSNQQRFPAYFILRNQRCCPVLFICATVVIVPFTSNGLGINFSFSGQVSSNILL